MSKHNYKANKTKKKKTHTHIHTHKLRRILPIKVPKKNNIKGAKWKTKAPLNCAFGAWAKRQMTHTTEITFKQKLIQIINKTNNE